jgi:DNA topoisomerase VI subunit A
MDKVNIEIPDINEYSNVIKQKLKERNLKRISDNYKRAQFLSEDEQKRLNFNLTLKNTFEKWKLDPKELKQLNI